MKLIVNKHFPPSLWVNAVLPSLVLAYLIISVLWLLACIFYTDKWLRFFLILCFHISLIHISFFFHLFCLHQHKKALKGHRTRKAVRSLHPYVDLSLAKLIVSAGHNAIGFSPPLPIPGRNSCHYQWYLTPFSSVIWDIHSLKMGTTKMQASS